MSEYCAISTRKFSRKEVNEFGRVTTLRKRIGLEIELKLDIDDPVEKMQTLAELVDDKYDEEVTMAVLVSKFK